MKNQVAFFLPSLRGGGAERTMINLVRGFTDRSYIVDLVLAKAEGPYLSEVPSSVRIVDLHASRVLFALPRLVRYLRQERPRVLLSTLSHANLIALWARWLARVETRIIVREASNVSINTLNTINRRGKLIPFLLRLFFPWADTIVALSKGVADDLIFTINLPKEKVRVVYNPVITPNLLTKAEEPVDHPWFVFGEPPVLISVGRLTLEKDHPTLIRAFAQVRQQIPARLMILGEGDERPRLEALIRELGVEIDVALPGFVENPIKYMKRSSVFVLSSRWEGFGNVLVEAMAVGIPVISTNCPNGPAEITNNGEFGSLVPIGDVDAMAKSIRKALDKPWDEKAQVWVMTSFTQEKSVQQYAEIFGI